MESFNQIIAVDVFLEKHTRRIYAGQLKRQDQYQFTYAPAYLKEKNVIPLGPEFPLTRSFFQSQTLFSSFEDRIPDRDNPAYPDYCASQGITTDIDDPIILLPTIGRQGPSSFIFEPVYETQNFTWEDCENFRSELGLSLADFAIIVGASLSIFQKIKAGSSSGKEILRRIEIYKKFPQVLDCEIKANGKFLHSKRLQKLTARKHMMD
jgi:HipA-like protein